MEKLSENKIEYSNQAENHLETKEVKHYGNLKEPFGYKFNLKYNNNF
jgi:hypothetical protein